MTEPTPEPARPTVAHHHRHRGARMPAPVLTHDPLCPVIATDCVRCPQCDLIARVRADERGRVHATIQAGEIPASLYEEMAYDLRAQIADEIEALPHSEEPCWNVNVGGTCDCPVNAAARIARGES